MSDDSTFHFNINELADEILVSPEYPVFTTNEDTDIQFILYHLNSSESFKNFCVMQKLGGTRTRLYFKKLENYQLFIPSINEQRKITLFLQLLNKKFEKQQEKIEKLEQFKKGMMQKVFTRELRFKDEDGGEFPEWETKELRELGEFKRSYSYSRSYEGPGEYYHIHYGDIHTKLRSVINRNTYLPSISIESELEILETGEVIFADASEDYKDLGKSVVVKQTKDRKIVSGLHTHRFKPNGQLDSAFLMYFTKTKKYLAFIRMFGTGVSVLGISKNNLGTLEVPLPSIEEQLKISDYLSTIDDKIEKENEKLMVLEKQKKGFMWGMFV